MLTAYDDEGAEVALVHADDPQLRRMAVFDVIVNNADRKGGHVLTGVDGAVVGVSHEVALHAEDKLRTVLWGWAGTCPGCPDATCPARAGRTARRAAGNRAGGAPDC